MSKKSLKTYPLNISIPLFLFCFGPIWAYLSGQKVDFQSFRFCPIVEFMISLYKLNTRGAGPTYFHKL